MFVYPVWFALQVEEMADLQNLFLVFTSFYERIFYGVLAVTTMLLVTCTYVYFVMRRLFGGD